jgi:hypothetical protein
LRRPVFICSAQEWRAARNDAHAREPSIDDLKN